MELRHLRYFVAAAEELHFGRASDKLHVTRPAVSKLIADLEDELGMLLFERQGHRVSLTAAGRKLLPDIKAVMQTLTNSFAAAKKISEGKSGNLSIGYGTLTLHNNVFRASIKKFKETHPEVSLTLVELPTKEQPKAIAEGRVTAGFMHFGRSSSAAPRKRTRVLLATQDESSLEWLTIETGRLGVIMEQGHPLAARKQLSLKDLAGEKFILVPNSTASPSYGVLYAMCQSAGYEPQIGQEVVSLAAMLNLVLIGIGIGLCVTGKHFSYPREFRIVPLREVNYSTQFVVGWLKGRHDPLVEALLATVKSVANIG